MEIYIKEDKNERFFDEFWKAKFYKKKKDEKLIAVNINLIKSKIESLSNKTNNDNKKAKSKIKTLNKKIEKIKTNKEMKDEEIVERFVLIGRFFFEQFYYDLDCKSLQLHKKMIEDKINETNNDYFICLKEYLDVYNINKRKKQSSKLEDFSYKCYKAVRPQIKILNEESTLKYLTYYKKREKKKDFDASSSFDCNPFQKDLLNLNLNKIKLTLTSTNFEYFRQDQEYVINECNSFKEFQDYLDDLAFGHIKNVLYNQYEYGMVYLSCLKHKDNLKIKDFFEKEEKTIEQYFSRITKLENKYQMQN